MTKTEIETSKVLLPADGNFEVELMRTRYRQLREYVKRAEREMEEIRAKLGGLLDEAHADALTVDGETVVLLVTYDREVVDVTECRTRYPELFKRIARTTSVRRVDIH